MQELSNQKSRLLEQINDLKSRDKALELEIQSMDDIVQTKQRKVHDINTNIQTMESTITDLQRRTIQEKSLLENFEHQKRDLKMKLSRLQSERESLNSSFRHLNQTNEFGKRRNKHRLTFAFTLDLYFSAFSLCT